MAGRMALIVGVWYRAHRNRGTARSWSDDMAAAHPPAAATYGTPGTNGVPVAGVHPNFCRTIWVADPYSAAHAAKAAHLHLDWLRQNL